MAYEGTVNQHCSLYESCIKQFSNRDAKFHGVSCVDSLHLIKSCAGISKSAISGIREMNQNVLLMCKQSITNSQRDRVLDSIFLNAQT